MYFSRNEIKGIAAWKMGVVICYACFFYLVGFLQLKNSLGFAPVSRNPPTAMVILQGMCAPVIIYMAARQATMLLPFYINRFFNFMGYNLLYFLITSTILYGFLSRVPGMGKLYWVHAVLLFMFLLCSMYFISTTVVPGDKAGRGLGHLKE